ncbi:MAG: MopE-related protein [Candidatus Woesearchaeota archaeon]
MKRMFFSVFFVIILLFLVTVLVAADESNTSPLSLTGVTCSPTPEICDSLDNDCDSVIDNGLSLSQPCSVGVGACISTGFQISTCSSGSWSSWSSCSAIASVPTPEICDSLDNDCDGQVDEDVTKRAICGYGVCAGNIGTVTCSFGSWIDNTCNPFNGASIEVCDDFLDNDCDNSVDEDCACKGGDNRSCGQTDIGECILGQQKCFEGLWRNCMGYVDPMDEICDSLDNDCDGLIDEERVCLDTRFYNVSVTDSGKTNTNNGLSNDSDGDYFFDVNASSNLKSDSDDSSFAVKAFLERPLSEIKIFNNILSGTIFSEISTMKVLFGLLVLLIVIALIILFVILRPPSKMASNTAQKSASDTSPQISSNTIPPRETSPGVAPLNTLGYNPYAARIPNIEHNTAQYLRNTMSSMPPPTPVNTMNKDSVSNSVNTTNTNNVIPVKSEHYYESSKRIAELFDSPDSPSPTQKTISANANTVNNSDVNNANTANNNIVGGSRNHNNT